MRVAIYSPIDPTFVGGFRTWITEFWRPYATSRDIQLVFVHAGMRPTGDVGAYKAIDDFPSLQVRRVKGAFRVSGAPIPSANAIAGAVDGADVLYIDNGYALQDVAALRAARQLSIPTISGHHAVIQHSGFGLRGAMHNGVWNCVGKRFVHSFDVVHALNLRDADYLRSCGAKVALVAHPPVDLDLFKEGTKAKIFTVLFVGRLHRQKGVDRLMALVHAMLASWSGDFEIKIVGDGPDRGLTLGLEADPRFKALPTMDRSNVAAEMRRAHLLVAPSRAETFGFVAAEALASGTPVIAAETNGFAEIVDSATGVLLSQNAAVDSWLAAVESMAQLTPEQVSTMGRAGRQRAERFSFSRVATAFDSILEFALRGRR